MSSAKAAGTAGAGVSSGGVCCGAGASHGVSVLAVARRRSAVIATVCRGVPGRGCCWVELWRGDGDRWWVIGGALAAVFVKFGGACGGALAAGG